MIQFPGRKEARVLISLPSTDIDTITFADQCDEERDLMWHTLSQLENKGYVTRIHPETKYKNGKKGLIPLHWRLTQMGIDMSEVIKKYVSLDEQR